MNKKGFTLVELITTFALASVIIVLLINVIVIIKSIYSNTNVKTELLINQSNLSNAMNKVISSDNVVTYDECNDSDFCYNFKFYDGESSKLIITNNVIRFGNYTYKLKNDSRVENPSVTKEHISGIYDNNDTFLIIKIPIRNDKYPSEDFGINLIYPYNSNTSLLGV